MHGLLQKSYTIINNVFNSQYYYSSSFYCKYRHWYFQVLCILLFSIQSKGLLGIHFVLFHAILGKQQGSWKNKFFSTIPSNELIFYRIDPLGFIGIRLPVLRKSVCCVFVCVIGSILKQVLISGTFFYLIHFGKITLLPTIQSNHPALGLGKVKYL